MKSLSPIILFVYNRPYQTIKILNFLKKNSLSRKSDLIVFSDGSKKNNLDKKKVEIVRIILKNLKGFKSKKIYFRKKNLGLFKNIMEGLDNVFKKYNKAIILEDDILVNKYFLNYMNECLDLYNDEKKVSSIHAWFCEHNKKIQNTFFLQGSDIWGWATWKRSWNSFNKNPKKLLKKFENNLNLIKKFNLLNAYDYYGLLKKRAENKNQSWGILWNAYNFLNNSFYLNFSNSLCINIGQDESGTHTSFNKGYFNQRLFNKKIKIKKQKVEEDVNAEKIKSDFFKKSFTKKDTKMIIKSLMHRISNKLKGTYKKKQINYFGPFKNWKDAISNSKGYDNKLILNNVLKNTMISKKNLYYFERDGYLLSTNTIPHYQLNLILKMINKKKRGLNIVDLGGSLGSSYFKMKDIINQNYKNTWNIVEQKSFVKIGRKKLKEKGLNFFDNLKNLRNKKIDVLILSGSLQYLEDPNHILKIIFDLKPEIILLERLSILKVKNEPTICVQKRGDNSYPIWFFSNKYIIEKFKKNKYNLVESFPPEFDHNLYFNKRRIKFDGFLFKKRDI